ncbi:MAG: RNA polymerase sigma-70 factor [Flavobacterium sp.]|nr:RNA polymerase sigma-70 factor [Flavobacterium sp.]
MSTASDYNESLLVSELKNHNEKAFRRLFDIYYQDIYGYSVSLLKSKELAEENVQDVFLKVWLYRENLDTEKSFKSFLFTIARNQAFNILNKAANDVVLKEAIFYSAEKSHEEGDYSIRESDCKKIKKYAIKQLPPKRKQIFKMSRKQGKTYEEISLELGISINTVKSQMSKALESLRLYLNVHDEYT